MTPHTLSNRTLWRVAFGALLFALILFAINAIMLPRVIALDRNLKASCESRNTVTKDANLHLRAYVRLLLVRAGDERDALSIHDAPYTDCSTGRLDDG